MAGQDREYRREFTAAIELLAEERALACTGLDTLAELTLNGDALGVSVYAFADFQVFAAAPGDAIAASTMLWIQLALRYITRTGAR